jgi:phosphatidylserine/phosphatidylglycerophosphate/cardiolipin synthase-like enzyme
MSDAALDWLRRSGLEAAQSGVDDPRAVDWLVGRGRSPRFLLEGEQGESGPGARSGSSIFLPGNTDTGYAEYVRPATAGTATLLINGRSSGGLGPNVDLTEPLDRMQDVVQSLRAGDRVYLSAWFFEPRTELTHGAYGGATNWGELLAHKANGGVVIRILINDFDPVSGMDRWLQTSGLDQLNPLINALPTARQDNFKYVVSLHPAHVGALKALFATRQARAIHVASHHQKFMVCRRGEASIAFCGGLDIESRKTPARWAPNGGLFGWHDVHVMLEGPVARDLQQEFVMRWNREKGASTRRPLRGWRGYETLALPAPLRDTDVDMQPARRRQRIQMLRTVSSDAWFSPYSTEREDIRQVYGNIVAAAREYLYLENQYFRSLGLADSLARAAAANPRLIAIFVVVFSAAEDDGENAITAHGAYLQHEFFRRLTAAFGRRSRIYTMTRRAVHSKLLLADDRYVCVGSANANDRSFELDSELNVAIDDPTMVRDWRRRLWRHNLGVAPATLDSWPVSSYLSGWDATARANDGLPAAGRLDDMSGEGVVPFDWSASPGSRHGSIPDALAHLDFDPRRDERPATA